MAIGVHTDMATPALAKFGSPELRQLFLTPSIKGCPAPAFSDPLHTVTQVTWWRAWASVRWTRPRTWQASRRLPSRSHFECVFCLLMIINRTATITSSMVGKCGPRQEVRCVHAISLIIASYPRAGRLDVSACQHRRPGSAPQQVAHLPAHEDKGCVRCTGLPKCNSFEECLSVAVQVLDKMGMFSSDTAQITFDNVRVPIKYRIGDEGKGFYYQMLQVRPMRSQCVTSDDVAAVSRGAHVGRGHQSAHVRLRHRRGH